MEDYGILENLSHSLARFCILELSGKLEKHQYIPERERIIWKLLEFAPYCQKKVVEGLGNLAIFQAVSRIC
ncbi:MAG: hypothetical protein AB2693_26930 [Candidatus Thiodiazotropha sp.]